MIPTLDALYSIHLYQAARRGRSPLPYAGFRSRLQGHTDTDLTQLFEAPLPPAWKVEVQILSTPNPPFALGELLITPAAAEAIPHADVLRALDRHAQGDWGLLDPHDRHENERALASRGRVMSVYRAQNGCRFWIITDPGWEVTTVLLPQDY